MNCVICNDEFIPKNTKQRTCPKVDCKKALRRLASQRYAEKVGWHSQADKERNDYKRECAQMRALKEHWQQCKAAIRLLVDPDTHEYYNPPKMAGRS